MSIALRVRPHVESDPDGTFDSRYYTQAEVDALIASITGSSHDHDAAYYTKAEIDTLLAGKSNTGHAHDDRYYTEGEVDAALLLKAAASHTHDDRYFTEAEVTASLATKASTSHTHTFADITGKPATFTGYGANVANVTNGVGDTYDAVCTLGPLVSGQKYLITADGVTSFDGVTTFADINMALFFGAASWGIEDVSRAEGGVDTGYSMNQSGIYTGTGGTVNITFRVTVASGSINTRYSRVNAFAIPVFNS